MIFFLVQIQKVQDVFNRLAFFIIQDHLQVVETGRMLMVPIYASSNCIAHLKKIQIALFYLANSRAC
jgi:hypothetical protein